MKAGRELDALVAEKVMGYIHPEFALEYSTSWADVGLVVKKMMSTSDYYPFILTEDRYSGTYSKGKLLCSFGVFSSEYENGPLGDDGDAMDYWHEDYSRNIAAANTPPHAICLAALKAVGCKDFS